MSYWQELFEASQSGMAVFDPNGRIWEVNKTLTRMFGYSKEELLEPNFSWARIIAPEDLEMAMDQLMELLEKGIPQKFELTFIHKSGYRVLTLIAYDKLTRKPEWSSDRMVASIQDITDFKSAKENLELLLRLSPLGVAEWRPGGELINCNEQYARIVGYTKEEVFAMGWKNLTAPEYQGDPDRLHEEKARKGIDKTYRKEYVHKDSHRVPIYLTTEPIFKDNGEFDYYISYVQDLSPIVENERLIGTIL